MDKYKVLLTIHLCIYCTEFHLNMSSGFGDENMLMDRQSALYFFIW